MRPRYTSLFYLVGCGGINRSLVSSFAPLVLLLFIYCALILFVAKFDADLVSALLIRVASKGRPLSVL